MPVSHVAELSSDIVTGPGVSAEQCVRELVAMLGEVADPRQPRGVRHGIGTVLAVTVFAALAGARNFRECGDRAADLPPELLELAGCRQDPVSGRHVAPSEPTLRRVAHDIDADAADERVCAWLRRRAAVPAVTDGGAGHDGDGERLVAVAMDGKTVRNSAAPGDEGGEVKLFSAMLHQEAVVLAQLRVPDDTNEITQVSALLAGIELDRVVVTGDAAHAQHATAAHVTGERGGAYALTVKGNQPSVLAQIAAALPRPVPGTEEHSELDTSKGRQVRRRIWSAPAADIDFPAAAQVFVIRRDVFDSQGHWLSKETVHGITSLTTAQAAPAAIARLIRQHWGIENKIHWVRDAVWREDEQRAYAGAGAQVMATARNLALSLLRLAGITSIKRTLERIAADRTRILPLLTDAITT